MSDHIRIVILAYSLLATVVVGIIWISQLQGLVNSQQGLISSQQIAIAELRKQIDEQRKLLDEQNRRIATLEIKLEFCMRQKLQ